MSRADACRKAAEATDSPNERAAWEAAARAWDTLEIPKPKLSERGKQLAALYAAGRLLAAVPSAEEPPQAPTPKPKEPKPEPVKPQPTGAFATIDF